MWFVRDQTSIAWLEQSWQRHIWKPSLSCSSTTAAQGSESGWAGRRRARKPSSVQHLLYWGTFSSPPQLQSWQSYRKWEVFDERQQLHKLDRWIVQQWQLVPRWWGRWCQGREKRGPDLLHHSLCHMCHQSRRGGDLKTGDCNFSNEECNVCWVSIISILCLTCSIADRSDKMPLLSADPKENCVSILWNVNILSTTLPV